MKTKTYLLAGLLTLAVAAVAHADSLVDTWATWDATKQPDYVAGTGGTLVSDQTIANDDSGSGATLNVANFTGTAQGGGLYANQFLYTGNSAPTFTLASDTVLTDVATITVSFTAGGSSTFDSSTLSLTFDGASITGVDFSITDTGTMAFGSELFAFTYAWDVSSLATGSDDFTVGWTDNGQHTAFPAITLTQATAAAVPEPATYAAIFGGLVLAGAMLRRRFAGRSSC